MKTKYTPGTKDGLVGKTHPVEVVGISLAKVQFGALPLVRAVKIKYKDGKTEWVDGMKFYNDTLSNKDIIHQTF